MLTSRQKFLLFYVCAVCVVWSVLAAIGATNLKHAAGILPIVLIVMFGFFGFGVLLSKKIKLTSFVLLTVFLNLFGSSIVAAFNQSIDPGDGTFFRNFCSMFLLIASLGIFCAFGFALAQPKRLNLEI